jgi:NADH oxidase (H2O2-forming)
MRRVLGGRLADRVVVLGGGIAGYTAAQTMKRADRAIRITVVSEEADRTYSACVLAEYIAGEMGRDEVFIRSREQIPFGAGEWMGGRKVLEIDLRSRSLVLEAGESLRFDRLVLATGSRPVVPRLPGIRKEGVHCLKSLSDADALFQARGRQGVVVGSGPVGLEVAAALRKRGWEVAVVEVLDRILPRLFGSLHSERLQKLLESHGVSVFTGERVLEIGGAGHVEAVVTDQRSLPCQLVVLGIGMVPEVGLAERAGIRLGSQGGIFVDGRMRTSYEDVFACGDCAESVDRLTGRRGLGMLWGNAKMQAAVAGANCLGLGKRYPGAMNITTLKLFDTMAVSAGDVLLADGSYRELVQSQRERGSVRLVLKDGVIQGIQAVGAGVDIHVFLQMMLCGVQLHALRDARDKRVLLGQKPWLVRLPPSLRE